MNRTRLLGIALTAVVMACSNPTTEEHPEWLAHRWKSGDEELLIDRAGTYADSDFHTGRWSYDGTDLLLGKSRFEVAPLVACRLVKIGPFIYDAPYETIVGCPRTEPELTDVERCFAGGYGLHINKSFPGYTDTDNTDLSLEEDHYYKLTRHTFKTDGYVSNSGTGEIAGRWEVTSEGFVRLTPVRYSGLDAVPTAEDLRITIEGKEADVDGEIFTFAGGCK